jgi:Holliday junction resolvase RusA-like endonuclease
VPHPQAGQRVSFTVLGPPQPWQRAGTTRKGVRYTQKETLQYERAIKTAAFCAGLGVDRGILPSGYALSLTDPRPSWPKDARYRMTVHAYFANQRRRDLDNVLKACGDALNSIAYEDDSQIDELRIKRGCDATTPRTEITIEVLP